MVCDVVPLLSSDVAGSSSDLEAHLDLETHLEAHLIWKLIRLAWECTDRCFIKKNNTYMHMHTPTPLTLAFFWHGGFWHKLAPRKNKLGITRSFLFFFGITRSFLFFWGEGTFHSLQAMALGLRLKCIR